MKCRQDWHVVSLRFAIAIEILIGSSVTTEHAFQAYILGTAGYVSVSPLLNSAATRRRQQEAQCWTERIYLPFQLSAEEVKATENTSWDADGERDGVTTSQQELFCGPSRVSECNTLQVLRVVL